MRVPESIGTSFFVSKGFFFIQSSLERRADFDLTFNDHYPEYPCLVLLKPGLVPGLDMLQSMRVNLVFEHSPLDNGRVLGAMRILQEFGGLTWF